MFLFRRSLVRIRELLSHELTRLGRTVNRFPCRHGIHLLSVRPLRIGRHVRRRIALATLGI